MFQIWIYNLCNLILNFIFLNDQNIACRYNRNIPKTGQISKYFLLSITCKSNKRNWFFIWFFFTLLNDSTDFIYGLWWVTICQQVYRFQLNIPIVPYLWRFSKWFIRTDALEYSLAPVGIVDGSCKHKMKTILTRQQSPQLYQYFCLHEKSDRLLLIKLERKN